MLRAVVVAEGGGVHFPTAVGADESLLSLVGVVAGEDVGVHRAGAADAAGRGSRLPVINCSLCSLTLHLNYINLLTHNGLTSKELRRDLWRTSKIYKAPGDDLESGTERLPGHLEVTFQSLPKAPVYFR